MLDLKRLQTQPHTEAVARLCFWRAVSAVTVLESISHGNPLLCREAVTARDALIEKLAATPPVLPALDQFACRFGHETVVEVTGCSA